MREESRRKEIMLNFYLDILDISFVFYLDRDIKFKIKDEL